jgi:hypothetical protein
MKPRLYIPDEAHGDLDASDSEFALRAVSVDTGANDFDNTVAKYIQNGAMHISPNGIVVVGGRKSISQSFGHIPVQNYRFCADNGYNLVASFSRCAPARGRVIDYALQDAGNVFLGPVNHLVTAVEKFNEKKRANPNTSTTVGRLYSKLMKSTYHPGLVGQKLEVYDEGLKMKTVLRIFAAAANFNGVNLGAATTGAGISLRLRQIWGI